MKDLKTKIREIRKSYGLSQEKYAEMLGLKRGCVNTYELGTAKPSIDTLIKICDMENITLDQLCKDNYNDLTEIKTLKLDQLKEGCIYWCVLSDRKVLITSLSNEKKYLPHGEIVFFIECNAIAYSVNGTYDSVIVWDNQLSLTKI